MGRADLGHEVGAPPVAGVQVGPWRLQVLGSRAPCCLPATAVPVSYMMCVLMQLTLPQLQEVGHMGLHGAGQRHGSSHCRRQPLWLRLGMQRAAGAPLKAALASPSSTILLHCVTVQWSSLGVCPDSLIRHAMQEAQGCCPVVDFHKAPAWTHIAVDQAGALLKTVTRQQSQASCIACPVKLRGQGQHGVVKHGALAKPPTTCQNTAT